MPPGFPFETPKMSAPFAQGGGGGLQNALNSLAATVWWGHYRSEAAVMTFEICDSAGILIPSIMKPPRAAIFDLDGTLLDTLQDLADSANEALTAAGLPVHPVDAFRIFVGDGVDMLVQRMLPVNHCDDETVAKVLAFYRAAYGRRWDNLTRPFPGIPETLHELSLLPVKLAVLSNKPQNFTELCIARHFPQGGFHLIYGHRDNVPESRTPLGPWRSLTIFRCHRMKWSSSETLRRIWTPPLRRACAPLASHGVSGPWRN